MTERLVYILSGSIVFAGLWIGGLYSVSGGNGDAHVINRITGTTWYCGRIDCYQTRVRSQ